MSVMESFYGGRQGAGIIIVKRFDGIDIPQPGDGSGVTTYTYTANDYAVNESGLFIITTKENGGNVQVGDNSYLIGKDKSNYASYAWVKHDNNGSRIDNTSFNFPEQLAEGMVQCFAKGAKSASEVQYGEYVLIDTILNMHSQNDPDNGKVFRRGMNVDSELAGAEYIGNIVGPKGDTAEIQVESESYIQQQPGYRTDSYRLSDKDIVPGYYVDGYSTDTFLGTYYNDVYSEILNNVENPQTGILYKVLNGGNQVYEFFIWTGSAWEQRSPQYNDDIHYSWVTIRDEFGNVEYALIGFTFPYLVEEFTATAVSAYYHRDSEGVPFRNKNLIERIDDGSHSYYQSWRILVPEGIKGDAITKLEKINTQLKKGTVYYNDRTFIQPAGTLSDLYDLDIDNVDYSLDYFPIQVDGELYYVKNDGSEDNTCTSVVRYTQTNYDRVAEGENKYFVIGPYNSINSIWIEDNGDVYVDYTYENIVKLNAHLKWVDNMVIKQNGDYIITYNDETKDEGNIHFIDSIIIDGEGTVTYYYSDGSVADQQEKLIRWITGVTFDTHDGNGSQQIVVSYNNRAAEAIGDPINYILEAVVSESRAESSETKPFHLLVLYSDPAVRAAIPADKRARYRSMYPDGGGQYIRSDWYDMGNIRGAKGGLGILTKLDDEELLHDDSANEVPIPPEYMNTAIETRASGEDYIWQQGVGIDEEYAGWLIGIDVHTSTDPYAMDVYFYDYTLELWTKVSGFGGGGVDPAQVVRISPASEEPSDPELEEDGIWFILETRKVVK